ncbi:tetratricopeptide repeat protein [uncultured Desulfobacter sp.]|uniref:tetratricopeptide repeat protein n=1 Tax=uncultured Desulfobacter sp. TaxID=240139 RepID=UPI002AA6F758|nr:tetratricopeptide repeat protein [uncultured Desulfobacter sp.]
MKRDVLYVAVALLFMYAVQGPIHPAEGSIRPLPEKPRNHLPAVDPENDEKPHSLDFLNILDGLKDSDDYRRIRESAQKMDDAHLKDEFYRIDAMLNDGYYEDALSRCEKVLKNTPGIWLFHYCKAVAYHLIGRLDESLRELNRAMALNPDLPNVQLWQANIYLQKGDLAKANERIFNALKANQHNLEARLLLAKLKIYKQDYAGGIDEIKNVIRLSKTNENAHILLAKIYSEMGRHKEALDLIESFSTGSTGTVPSQRVQAAKIEFLLALKQVGQAQTLYEKYFQGKETYDALTVELDLSHAQKDYDKSIAVSEKLIEKYPRSYAGFLSGLYAGLSKRDFAQSEKLLQKMKGCFPTFPWINKVIADVLFARERYAQAEIFYRKALARHPESLSSYQDLGWCYTTHGRYQDALDVFQAGFERFPRDYLLHKFAGKAYRELNLYKKSIIHYQQAIKVFPDRIGAHVGLGSTYNYAGNLDLAIESYQRAIKIYPYYFEPFWGIANASLKQKNYPKAIKYAKTAISMSPQKGLPYSTLAQAYYDAGEPKQAEAVCRGMTDTVTSNAEGLLFLGYCWRGIEKFDEALAAFQASNKISPGSNKHEVIGNIYQNLGKYPEAVQDYDRAFEMGLASVDLYYNIGLCYLNLSRLDEAEASLKKALALNPEGSKTYHGLADVYLKKDMRDLALDHLNRAVELDPGNTKALCARGRQLGLSGKQELAMRDYNRALEIDNESALAYHLRGTLYAAREDFENATADYRKALKINPEYVECHVSLGLVYQKQSRFIAAQSEYEKAAAINPDSEVTRLALGNLFLESNAFNQAIRQYEIGLEKGRTLQKELNYSLGLAYKKKGDVEKAALFYQKTLEADPAYFQAHYNLGVIYGQSGALDKSEHHFQEALKTHPKDVDTLNNLGYTYYLKRMFTMADECYAKALGQMPSNGLCHYNKALNHYAQKEFNLAVRHLDLAAKNGYKGSPRFHHALEAYRN